MLLRNIDGTSVELKILNYQFPDHAPRPNDKLQYDCNWLVIETWIHGTHEDRTFTDPCMLTYDAERLYTWLVAIEQGTAKPVTGGLEPNITFELIERDDSSAILRFEYMEYVPSIRRWQHHIAPLELTFDDLKRAAAEWYSELQRFPVRYAKSTLDDS